MDGWKGGEEEKGREWEWAQTGIIRQSKLDGLTTKKRDYH